MKLRVIDIDLYNEHESFQRNAVLHVAKLIVDGKAHFIRYSRRGNMHVLLDREREDCYQDPNQEAFCIQLGLETILPGAEWVEASLHNLFSMFDWS